MRWGGGGPGFGEGRLGTGVLSNGVDDVMK